MSINFKINNIEVTGEPDETILNVALRNKIYIPHFCYHPCLSISGNCRMCLVKIGAIPKLATACTTYPADKMEVFTDTEELKKARSGVMEFLLINHPLDCPICDQAGECRLQDYAFIYGRDHSRFTEEKVHKKRKTLGKLVKYWPERCILCTRCVRFCEEITGTGELSVVDRGNKSYIDIFDKSPLDNLLSGNVVDICPVGALLSTDFLYKTRVWFLKQNNSICPHCSVGCNIRIDVSKNIIRRIVPRKNLDVNGHFICDIGRLGYKFTHSQNRILNYRIKGKNVLMEELLEQLINTFASTPVLNRILFFSAFSTVEDLELIKKLIDHKMFLLENIFVLKNQSQSDINYPKFSISGDRNPNIKGIEDILGEDVLKNQLAEIEKKINNQTSSMVYVYNKIPDFNAENDIVDFLKKIKKIIVHDIMDNSMTERADYLLPALTYAESRGSFINNKNIRQYFEQAVVPSPEIKNIQEIFRLIQKGIDLG